MEHRRRQPPGGVSTSGLNPARFRVAGLACLGGAVGLTALYLLHLFIPSVSDEAAPLFSLSTVILLLAGVCLFTAPWLWRRQRSILALLWLARILTVASIARALSLLAASAGWRLQFTDGPHLLVGDAQPIMLLKASLLGLVAVALLRAAWLSAPFSLRMGAHST